jgi:hypothetical protein
MVYREEQCRTGPPPLTGRFGISVLFTFSSPRAVMLKHFYLFVIAGLLMAAPALAQITASNAGQVYGSLYLDQTYYSAGVYNLKGSYTFSNAYYNANGCNCYTGTGYIRWTGAQWEIGGAIGGGHPFGCYYCTFERAGNTNTNTAVTLFSPPCTGWSNGAVLTGDCESVALPVTLTAFNATASGPVVRLDWATASEQNASHFEVERSLGLVDFETVGRVNAVGNSQTRQTYALTDESPMPGTSYYRLRQTDFDGKATTFKPVAVTMGEATGLLWANPSTGRSVRLRAPLSADVQLTTMQGRAIAFRKQAVDASTTELLPALVLPAGVYLVTVAGQSLKWVVE